MIEITCQILYLFTKAKQLDFVELGQRMGITNLEQRMQQGQFDINLEESYHWVTWLREKIPEAPIALQMAVCQECN